MMVKLKEAQQKIEATKLRLNTILIDGEAGNGLVKVTVSANRAVKNISISEKLTDKEEIEDLLVIALNKALEKATTEIPEDKISFPTFREDALKKLLNK